MNGRTIKTQSLTSNGRRLEGMGEGGVGGRESLILNGRTIKTRSLTSNGRRSEGERRGGAGRKESDFEW